MAVSQAVEKAASLKSQKLQAKLEEVERETQFLLEVSIYFCIQTKKGSGYQLSAINIIAAHIAVTLKR